MQNFLIQITMQFSHSHHAILPQSPCYSSTIAMLFSHNRHDIILQLRCYFPSIAMLFSHNHHAVLQQLPCYSPRITALIQGVSYWRHMNTDIIKRYLQIQNCHDRVFPHLFQNSTAYPWSDLCKMSTPTESSHGAEFLPFVNHLPDCGLMEVLIFRNHFNPFMCKELQQLFFSNPPKSPYYTEAKFYYKEPITNFVWLLQQKANRSHSWMD